MEENKEMLDLLKQIEKNGRQQVRNSRVSCLLALAAVVICVVALVQVMNLMPSINGLLEQAQNVMGNLEQTTEQLAAVDFEGMVDDVDALVSTGQQSLGQTMQKLETIDFDALNGAIGDLAAVVEPMAKFFSAFR